MNVKKLGRLIAAGILLTASIPAIADEVVHFTNGAEMTVRAHTVEKEMVRLDLGGNSSITFPMSMVDKIVSAGQDVFLNPAFHPTNQAVAGTGAGNSAPRGSTGSVIADTMIRGGGGSVGMVRGQGAPNTNGAMLGEASDIVNDAPGALGSAAITPIGNPHASKFKIAQPQRYDPNRPPLPGQPAAIAPPASQGGAPSAGRQISIRPQELVNAPAPPPPQQAPPPESQDGSDSAADPPQSDPPAQDPPENP